VKLLLHFFVHHQMTFEYPVMSQLDCWSSDVNSWSILVLRIVRPNTIFSWSYRPITGSTYF